MDFSLEQSSRTTLHQYLTMIEFMERHGDISNHQIYGSRFKNDMLWQELTAKLNSIKGGVRKSHLKWRKVWSDLKNNTKKKYHRIKMREKDGETNRICLNSLETRVLALLNQSNIEKKKREELPVEYKVDMSEMQEIYIEVQNDKEDKTQAILSLFNKTKEELNALSTAEEELQKKLDSLKIDNLFDDFFTDMSWNNTSILSKSKKKKRRLFHFEQLDLETGKLKSNLGGVDVEKEMQKSVLKPGVEKEQRLPSYYVSEKKLKAMRKKERQKTKGPGWFDMKAPEVTEELKNDLNILKMRSVLDPKHFYKKNDMEVLPKYFQVGTIMDSALDHVNERLTRKERKRTMVDELLADAEFQKYNKKKYKEIIDEKRKTEYRTFMKDKRQKNKAALKANKIKPKKSVK